MRGPMSDETVVPQVEQLNPAAEYEPPRVETVVTADELAREIQYAGITVVVE